MTRKKVDLSYIASDTKRKATFRKRKNGLIKKIDEISTLCGIEVGAIIYGPNEPQPEVWPSHLGVRRVISKFRRMTQLEQKNKMLNQESFLRQSIMKIQEKLKKQKSANRKKEITHLMFQCLGTGKIIDNVSMDDLNDLSWMIDQTLKDIERKLTSRQPQEGTPVVANGAQVIDGEKAFEDDHVQRMMETNGSAMQQQHWSIDSVNGGGNVPFGDVNLPISGIWSGTSIP